MVTSVRPRRMRPLDRKATTTRTSLSLPPAMPIDEWRSIGEQIHALSDASTWWLGDWLVYGQNRYPDRYKRAIEKTGLDHQTLRNYAWVARKFPPERRHGGLSMQHHLEVAALPEQEQDAWLERAERFGWSKATLRQYLRASRGALPDGERREETVVVIKIDSDRRRLWQQQAARAGRQLDEWMQAVLDEACSADGAIPA